MRFAIFFSVLTVSCGLSYAQDSFNISATGKELFSKLAIKEGHRLRKEGWYTKKDLPAIETQLENAYLLWSREDKEGDKTCILTSGLGEDVSMEKAEMVAYDRAENILLMCLGSNIASTYTSSTGGAKHQLKSISETGLDLVPRVLEIYRKNIKESTVEAYIMIYYEIR